MDTTVSPQVSSFQLASHETADHTSERLDPIPLGQSADQFALAPAAVIRPTDVIEKPIITTSASTPSRKSSSTRSRRRKPSAPALFISTSPVPLPKQPAFSPRKLGNKPTVQHLESPGLKPPSTPVKEVSLPSSPLSNFETPPRCHFPHDSPSPGLYVPFGTPKSPPWSPLTATEDRINYEYDYDGPEGHRIFRVKPTVDQWSDFPAILDFARERGADDDGCFKIVLPQALYEPLPEKGSQKVPANAYKPKHLRKNNFWRVDTVPSEGTFASDKAGRVYTRTAMEAVEDLRKMYRKSNNKIMRDVRYRVDVPAWTAEQRQEAGVPERSPIYPLKGDKLDETKAIIPGIHTPYVYESGPYFGASFQIHAEDFRLVSLNHLYKGRKIWIVVPSTAVDIAEEALGRKDKCSQFMRHRAEFVFPQKLDKLGIPYRIVDQRPGETMVILPDAYHEGFSTGYTIAEAKNYADPNWTTDTYQPCETSCELATAISAELMRPLKEGEEQLDLCVNYEMTVESEKRRLDEDDESEKGSPKRVKG